MIVKNTNHLKEVARNAFSDTGDIFTDESAKTYDCRTDFGVHLIVEED